ncbi:DNA oxidative demethylase AlkB [Pseudomonas sp. NW5]|uniref:DNA oxidative demethylase AlkB n=1 Tax=Pseudomonas sp. NW5 TaxID=2934934 RepID=UPI0020221834|nr:DNA oxidative demethylase AlkB [Pseudomonas sp. NW5]
MDDLFAREAGDVQWLAPGVCLLPGYLLPELEPLLDALREVLAAAPLRRVNTPSGQPLSVAMSNCGALGWVSTAQGYCYVREDPQSGQPWPALPPLLQRLSWQAAQRAGFADFAADACLINRYRPGARMGLHQDRDEADFRQPIVSFSLGLPATFLLGGLQRRDRVQRLRLQHGDALVWGGPARLRYHGILPLEAGEHPRMGAQRINLTLRRAAP